MSARPSTPTGVLGALAGFFGLSALAGVLVTVMITPAIAVTSMTASTSISIFEDLPNFIELNRQTERNTIWAMDAGQEVQIATIFQQNREEVGWDDISQHAKDALTSGEDRRFYEHGGVDMAAVLRAAVGNVASGGITSGASTLTMQLVKNIFVAQTLEIEDPEERREAYQDAIDPDGFDRKLREMRLAISLEKKYTKEEILLAYLNIAGFGGTTYGIEAAAERYYNTTAKDLTPAQAASLIAIVQYPNLRSLDDPEHYGPNQERRDEILFRMLEDGKLTQEQYDEAIATPVDETTVTLSNPSNGCRNAHPNAKLICDYVLKSIEDLESLGATPEERRSNWARGGYEIHTSLDIGLNRVAEDTLRAHIPAEGAGFNLGGVVTSVQVGTGFIVTMAQNKHFDDSVEAEGVEAATAVNLATDYEYGGSSGFQPGSTFKPFTLLAWLQEGNGLQQVVNVNERTHQPQEFTYCGAPYNGDPWSPGNDQRERGSRTVVGATVGSINGGFAEMAKAVDLCQISSIAESLGVHGAKGEEIQDQYLPFIIGSAADHVAPLTMAAAYAGIANNGVFCAPRAVRFVIDSSGAELPGEPEECRQAVEPGIAAAAIYAMNQAWESYPQVPSNVPMFGKTGTTDRSVQTWLMGSSTKVATATWTGNISGTVSMRDAGYNSAKYAIMRDVVNAQNGMFGGDPLPPVDQKYMYGTNAAVVPGGIIGASPSAAAGALQAIGLRVVEGGPIDSELPAGVVAGSSPAPGSRIARGGTVTIYTSNGALAGQPVPSVVGMTEQEAHSALAGAGFGNVSVACEPIPPGNGNGNGNGNGQQQPNANEGRVVSQNPGGGGSARPGDTVTITVARTTC